MPGALGPKVLMSNFIARNISSTCSSSGSEIWASTKNIKPLVDANYHTEAIEFAYHQSPIRFPPTHYQNPISKSLAPNGQTILFGCPLEPRIVGELNRIPLVLEYLLDSLQRWPEVNFYYNRVGQKHRNCTTNSLYYEVEEYWPLVNELEQAWTGVEETDRAMVSRLALQDTNCMFLIMVFPLQYTMQKLSDFVGILYGPSTASMDRP